MKEQNMKGLTLLEVIIALAILAIVVVGFLPVFISGFKGITTAGNKSDTIFQSQNETEDKILEGATSNASTMEINFPSVTGAVSLPGEDVTKGSVKVFIPD